ncbi:acylneuraminate cytidylyltransferase family protein [Ulvibacter antarcticus]|uniref:N-acylneuraminate cytidylyltransferase n=1 Tax=Ulvibacter antarcticus TaxID=442714 RepID=A0A3L9YC85_9FLAO|nr:acylneuraminate cytidylyltransferase family protein [Ulvibacter antarcticus]RMA57984.1 N-acylneuraminate cytidylyltransferase [Ulvibacter antarcticus]
MVESGKNIAIIPARGGSKRFPKKNLALLNNKQLIVYSIEYAKRNNAIIDAVYVSTDDSEIAKVAEDHGAIAIERPSVLSGDHEPTVTSLSHVISKIDEQVANVILLQVTNPLRPENLLQECFTQFQAGDFESAMTVTRNHQKFGKITNGNFVPFNYTFGQRSQDLDPLYFENGLLYITKASLISENVILGKKNLPFIVNHPFAEIDIDVEEDLIKAAFIYNNLIKK